MVRTPFQITWRIYKALALRLRDSSLMNYKLGRHTIREHLTTFSWPLLARTVPNPVPVHGHRIYHHSDLAFAVPFATGTYEPDTTGVVLSLLKEGQTFVDIGAHIGYFTLLAARAVGPGGRVYSFEPAPSNLTILRKNIQVNGYEDVVAVVPKAVCGAVGVRHLFLVAKENTGSYSIYHSSYERVDCISIDATTLDQFFQQERWPTVHIMKMDIEGAEKDALEGMAELSRRNPSLKLVVEFSPPNLQAAGTSPEELFQVLRDLGFTRVAIIGRSLIPVGEPQDILRQPPQVQNVYGNLLCEKPG